MLKQAKKNYESNNQINNQSEMESVKVYRSIPSKILKFDDINVETTVGNVIDAKSPIFFIENDPGKMPKITTIPNPYDLVMDNINAYIDSSKLYNFKEYSLYQITVILTNRFKNSMMLNFNAIFQNGLLNIIRPFLTCEIQKVYEIVEELIRFVNLSPIGAIRSESFLNQNDKVKSVQIMWREKIKDIEYFSEFYYRFIGIITSNGMLDMDTFSKFLAIKSGVIETNVNNLTDAELFDLVNKSNNVIPENSKYMFVVGCLLELSNEDIKKLEDVLEINLMMTIDEYADYAMNSNDKVNKSNVHRSYDGYDEF